MSRGVVARAARGQQALAERRANVRVLLDADHYDTLIQRELPSARVSVWIATANLKSLQVEAPIGTRARARGRYQSVLDVFSELISHGVEVRILHGRSPSGPFREELRRRPGARESLGMRECPRVHLKLVAIDGRALYLGSANFTGAGIGARGESRRNFELGILSDDEHLLDVAQERFHRIWSGAECAACGLRRQCPKPIDTLPGTGGGARARAKALRPR